ncbi:MAG: exonuclease domain-containing protein, partial [Spirochaetes bacterium]|nr:exonuclease domain-containing protein [Spirochaetota bacterium]
MPKGVMSQLILETPIAIIDFETTGLAPGPDRVVEVSVVRADPGKEPVLILDSLVNPDRPMAATE